MNDTALNADYDAVRLIHTF